MCSCAPPRPIQSLPISFKMLTCILDMIQASDEGSLHPDTGFLTGADYVICALFLQAQNVFHTQNFVEGWANVLLITHEFLD